MSTIDSASLASGLFAAKTLNLQSQIATELLKENADAEQATVLTLLGASSPADVGPGVGEQLDISA